MSAKIVERSLGAPSLASHALTRREMEVMDLVAEGLSNKHIAIRLDRQEKTVKHRTTQILQKLALSNRTDAAITWRQKL